MGLVRLITKDVVSENETRRGMVSLRILYLIICVAFAVDLIVAGLDTFLNYPYRIVIFSAAFVILFAMTYYCRTRTCLIGFNIVVFGWIFSMIRCFGWSAGMQNYFIMILLMCFFAAHGSRLFKFSLAFFVLLIRILTIFIYAGTKPDYPISALQDKLIQITNISAVFLAIIIISYIYSRDENEAEGKLMQFNDRLIKQANTDPLTGLSNRRRATEVLGDVIRDPGFTGVSLAMADIDFFKKVNDTYGHDAGDAVLKFVADTMKASCGEGGFVARWGGEEFLLVFPGKNGDETRVILEGIRTKVQKSVINVKEDEIRITMTFGLTEYDYQGDIEGTIKEADEKLYQGKMNGRNQVVF
jgi:diguanylate cyclase (GGDEF)-like protein